MTSSTDVQTAVPARALAKVTALVEARAAEWIADHQQYEKEINPSRPAPIRFGEGSALTYNRSADSNIRKAAIALGSRQPQEMPQDWQKYIEAAATARATAWRITHERGREAREAAAAEKQRAKRVHAEHVTAMKLNTKRVAALQKIITDAAKAEALLAELHRAFEQHKAAEQARRELQQMQNAAEEAARALNKPAPRIEITAAHADTGSMASIFVRAMRAMPSRG